jgi:hypothetical protein
MLHLAGDANWLAADLQLIVIRYWLIVKNDEYFNT